MAHQERMSCAWKIQNRQQTRDMELEPMGALLVVVLVTGWCVLTRATDPRGEGARAKPMANGPAGSSRLLETSRAASS
jgi:hypothetical protein